MLNNKKGQTTVEYLLLLSVILTITFAVFKSRYFKDFFGSDSRVFERIRLSMEYSYRNGLRGELPTPLNARERYATGRHDSYNPARGSRFFITKRYE